MATAASRACRPNARCGQSVDCRSQSRCSRAWTRANTSRTGSRPSVACRKEGQPRAAVAAALRARRHPPAAAAALRRVTRALRVTRASIRSPSRLSSPVCVSARESSRHRPRKMTDADSYGERAFWDGRYEETATTLFDWYQDWEALSSLLLARVPLKLRPPALTPAAAAATPRQPRPAAGLRQLAVGRAAARRWLHGACSSLRTLLPLVSCPCRTS